MSQVEWTQLAIFFIVLTALSAPLGKFISGVMGDKPHALKKILGPLEKLIYRLGGVDPGQAMDWKAYALACLAFNACGLAFLFLLLLLQGWLPLNPAKVPAMSWHLALNSAVSFVTNTNWQAYSGEAAASYLSQIAGFGAQNFLSAATALAVMAALARGLASHENPVVGNFWADLARGTVYILLPLSFLLAMVLVSQGEVQTFNPYTQAKTVECVVQVIPLGPAASQVAIKQLGTNGGGFFGVNSAHPFENPTPLSNWLECLSILLLPSASVLAFGFMLGKPRQGLALWAAMAGLLAASLGLALWAQYQQVPGLPGAVPLEGMETRIGVLGSVVWSQATSVASNGSVNAMHSSLSPLTGGLALWNILMGEVVFGGVGCGVYGMVAFALVTVFLAGLMVGRTPEYLGKRLGTQEVVLAMTACLVSGAVALVFTYVGLATEAGRAALSHQGPHGLTEALYAFASQANNNGSAFAGLDANRPFYNLLGSLAMLLGRFGTLLPMLALAGILGQKKTAPFSPGTFPTDTPLFSLLLACVVVVTGALTFFPALVLGPVLEHLLMLAGWRI